MTSKLFWSSGSYWSFPTVSAALVLCLALIRKYCLGPIDMCEHVSISIRLKPQLCSLMSVWKWDFNGTKWLLSTGDSFSKKCLEIWSWCHDVLLGVLTEQPKMDLIWKWNSSATLRKKEKKHVYEVLLQTLRGLVIELWVMARAPNNKIVLFSRLTSSVVLKYSLMNCRWWFCTA